MTKHLFDDLIGTPPPSSVDVDRIVRSERRRATAWRAGASVPAVVALALIAGITLTGPTAPVRTPIAQSPPAPAELTFRLVADTDESKRETAKHLRDALDEAVRQAAPGASWAGGAVPEVRYLPGEAAPPDRMFWANGTVRSGERGGNLDLAIAGVPCEGRSPCGNPDPRDLWKRLREELLSCQPGEHSCVESTGPRGERVVVHSESTSWPGYRTPVRWHDSAVELADGRVLQLRVANIVPVGERRKGAPAQAETPLSADQVTAAAVEIGSRIKR